MRDASRISGATGSSRAVDKAKIYLDSPPGALGQPARASRPGALRYLMTFHSGDPYSLAARRLERQARATGWFNRVETIHPEVKHPAMRAFLAQHGDFVRRHSRGYGYWRWKPLLTKAVLESLPEGAHLYYVDAGCELSRLGAARFAALDEELAQRGVLCFENAFREAGWCKREAVDAILGGWNEAAMSARQIQATWFGLRNVAAVREWIAQWAFWASCDALITDWHDPSRQHFRFQEHRHDQALWSLVLKKNGVEPLPQEDCFEKWLYVRDSWVLLAPVHGVRSRGARSLIDGIAAASTEQGCLDNLRAPSPRLKRRLAFSRLQARTVGALSRLRSRVRAEFRSGRPA